MPSYAGRAGRQSLRLTTQEKDVLLVLTAFCKLASREVPGANANSDSVLAQGKLLALEMLAKVCVVQQGLGARTCVHWGLSPFVRKDMRARMWENIFEVTHLGQELK